ncbi:monooxygenase family protein [Mycobacterium sp. PSTR-4-N]|uniref:monooxygenase family protein n=1 Tax=Mycobacterium sp. PSTR-4-N TaxID=2917745 RepID=UPI0035B3F76B
MASAPWRDPSNVIVVQYWRSVEGTRQVRQGASLTHAPAWAAFNRDAAGTGDIGFGTRPTGCRQISSKLFTASSHDWASAKG